MAAPGIPSEATLHFDPASPELRANPFPLFARLQEEDPVHWSAALRGWVVTRYDDVRKVVVAPQLSPDRLTPFYDSLKDARRDLLSEVMRYLKLWLVFRDPPEHTRLRRILNAVFTRDSVGALQPAVESIVEAVLDELDPAQPVEAVGAIAVPIPGYVILELLGIERARFPEIKAWSDDMRAFIGTARADGDRYRRARDGSDRMAGFFRELIAGRRARPGSDVVSRLIAARDEDGALSEDELIATCMLLLFGGHETTTNLISNAVNALLDHPQAAERLRAEPSLIDSAIEEFLRFDGPTGALPRIVRSDHELGGRLLRAGDRVFAMVNAANRDPRKFSAPHALDLVRKPNFHLAFGQGIHLCLGAPLARLEGRIALGRIVERFPGLRRAASPPEWIDALIMRGLARLPVRLAA